MLLKYKIYKANFLEIQRVSPKNEEIHIPNLIGFLTTINRFSNL